MGMGHMHLISYFGRWREKYKERKNSLGNKAEILSPNTKDCGIAEWVSFSLHAYDFGF